MSNDHNVTECSVLHVGYHGIHEIGEGDGREVGRLAATTGQVDREDTQFRLLTGQFGNGEIPAVAGVRAAVDEDEIGQCHCGRRLLVQ